MKSANRLHALEAHVPLVFPQNELGLSGLTVAV